MNYYANGIDAYLTETILVMHSNRYCLYWRPRNNILEIRHTGIGYTKEIHDDGSRSYGSGPENIVLTIVMHFNPKLFVEIDDSDPPNILYSSSQLVDQMVDRLLKLKAFV